MVGQGGFAVSAVIDQLQILRHALQCAGFYSHKRHGYQIYGRWTRDITAVAIFRRPDVFVWLLRPRELAVRTNRDEHLSRDLAHRRTRSAGLIIVAVVVDRQQSFCVADRRGCDLHDWRSPSHRSGDWRDAMRHSDVTPGETDFRWKSDIYRTARVGDDAI